MKRENLFKDIIKIYNQTYYVYDIYQLNSELVKLKKLGKPIEFNIHPADTLFFIINRKGDNEIFIQGTNFYGEHLHLDMIRKINSDNITELFKLHDERKEIYPDL